MFTRFPLFVLLVLSLATAGCAGRKSQEAQAQTDAELTASEAEGGPWLCVPRSPESARSPEDARSGERDRGWDCDNRPDKVANPGAYVPPKPPLVVLPEPIEEPAVEAPETVIPLTPVGELEAGTVDVDGARPPAQETVDQPPEPLPPIAGVGQVADAEEDTTSAAEEPVIDEIAGAPSAEAPLYQQLAYAPGKPVSLLELPPDFYAVQLTAMSDAAELERFFRELGIDGLSAAQVERDGRVFYVLLLGIYESFSKAQQASADLTPPLDRFDPWIRRLGTLQAAMERADALAESP